MVDDWKGCIPHPVAIGNTVVTTAIFFFKKKNAPNMQPTIIELQISMFMPKHDGQHLSYPLHKILT